MPGPLVQVGAAITCMHGGSAQIVPSNARVQAGGAFVAVLTDQVTIAGCPFQLPTTPPTPHPCVLLKWTVPATRVMVNGVPAIVQTSTGITQAADQMPQGAPLVSATQLRAVAT